VPAGTAAPRPPLQVRMSGDAHRGGEQWFQTPLVRSRRSGAGAHARAMTKITPSALVREIKPATVNSCLRALTVVWTRLPTTTDAMPAARSSD